MGIRSKTAVKSILQFLGSESAAAPSAGGSVYAPGLEEMVPYESVVMSILSNYAGLSLDRLQNMLLASSVSPK